MRIITQVVSKFEGYNNQFVTVNGFESYPFPAALVFMECAQFSDHQEYLVVFIDLQLKPKICAHVLHTVRSDSMSPDKLTFIACRYGKVSQKGAVRLKSHNNCYA